MDYKKALKYFEISNIKFDIVFLDPPYKTEYIEESIKLLTKYKLLNENAIIVCESDDMNKIVYSKEFMAIKEKKYGDKFIVILKKI